jgi:hypothetical protein
MLTHRHTLICDDVRREDNGKMLLIGVYGPVLVTCLDFLSQP